MSYQVLTVVKCLSICYMTLSPCLYLCFIVLYVSVCLCVLLMRLLSVCAIYGF